MHKFHFHYFIVTYAHRFGRKCVQINLNRYCFQQIFNNFQKSKMYVGRGLSGIVGAKGGSGAGEGGTGDVTGQPKFDGKNGSNVVLDSIFVFFDRFVVYI